MTEVTTESDAIPVEVRPGESRAQFKLLSLSVLKAPSDIALAVSIICILVVLLLTMPAWMLDFSLALSIKFSVLTLIIEYVRTRLARQRSNATANDEGIIPLMTLTSEWEQG